jgi:hypothetical protein
MTLAPEPSDKASEAVSTMCLPAVDRRGLSPCTAAKLLDVKVGSTTIGKISLKASAIHHKRVLLLPRFAPRTGTVTVKSVSTSTRIMIDGLVAIQKRSDGPV